MYTQTEYEADLAVERRLTEKFTKPEEIFQKVSINQNIRHEFVKVDLHKSYSSNKKNPDLVTEPSKKHSIYKGENIRLLKRSSLDLKKFRTTVKFEKKMNEDDDFSMPFLGLWPQFEFEFRKRFYNSFIPENFSIVMDILKETRQNKGNILADAEDPNMPVTFGLVNEVIYVIEYGCRRNRKRIMQVLSGILQGNVNQFFSSYSVYNCFKRLNADVRNYTMHENAFLDNKGYNEVCKMIFSVPFIGEWIGSTDKNLFSDYLNLLPSSAEEKYISELEIRIKKNRLGVGETTDLEIISIQEKELELLRMELEKM